MTEINLSDVYAARLNQLAQAQHLSQEKIIEKAIDLFFTVSEIFDVAAERQAWQRLSEAALYRVWDNPQDEVYNDWRELYGISER